VTASAEARLDRIENSLARIEESLKNHEHIHDLEEKGRVAALTTLGKDLEALNEVRTRFIPRETYEGLANRVATLENWRSRAGGMAAILTLGSGVAGAAIMRALTR
jgi:hypothetical protein